MSSVSKREFSTQPDEAADDGAVPSGKVSHEYPIARESGPQIAGASLFDDGPEEDWEVATRAGALGDAEVQALFQSTATEAASGADMSDMDFEDAPTRVGVSAYDAAQAEIPIEVAAVQSASALVESPPSVEFELLGDTGIRPTAYRVFAAPRADGARRTALVTHEAKAAPAQRLDAPPTSALVPRTSWWARIVGRLLRLLGR